MGIKDKNSSIHLFTENLTKTSFSSIFYLDYIREVKYKAKISFKKIIRKNICDELF